ncbi:CEN-like protein 2 isoform X2 [Sesbania bispinosa]|nr:CEN-like protein 2 isoform X2 [Sesbania bispinosa]
MTETTSFCQRHNSSNLRSPSSATLQQLRTPVVAGATALFVRERLCSRHSSSGNVSGRRNSSSGNVFAVCTVPRPSFCSRTTEEKTKKRKNEEGKCVM